MKKYVANLDNVLNRIQRALCGYISYLAACEMNESFSEYILYGPILRVLMAQGYSVLCEYPCKELRKGVSGDYSKIDFYLKATDGMESAIEVKWVRNSTSKIKEDQKKLEFFLQEHAKSRVFICAFGRKSHLDKIRLSQAIFKEPLPLICADLGKTKYGCRIFEFKKNKGKHERK